MSSHPVNDIAQPSHLKNAAATDARHTGSRIPLSLPNHMNSPTFDFTFERPESDLSAEAQKIMDSVREEAAKIKAQILEERAKQEHQDGEIDKVYGVQGRKLAKSTGKTGRFSDVHKQEFKKMDSIATHASTWKNKAQGEITQSLKRSSEKAGLDDATTPKSMAKSKSMRSLHFGPPESQDVRSPGKRARHDVAQDVSSARPVSRDTNNSTQGTPVFHRYTTKFPSAITTPTKASLARSASVKSMKSSMIPSLSRTASVMHLGMRELSAPKTEGSNKYSASLSRFSGSMKSILNRAQVKSSESTNKATPGTQMSLPKADFGQVKDLPSLPSSPSKGLSSMQQSPTIKCIKPSSSAVGNLGLTKSPSMSRIPTSRTITLSQYQAQHPLPSPPKADPEEPITYPLLASSPNITTRRPLPKPTTPGDFTFRADKEIEFSPTTISSPNGTTTIRVVRPSGFPTPMLGAFDIKPSIPHGMTNKKRKHGTDDNDIFSHSEYPAEESKENHLPLENNPIVDDNDGNEEEEHRRAKKQRLHAPRPSSSTPASIQSKVGNFQSPLKRRYGTGVGTGGGGRSPKKGAMTLARLSALARPKERR